MSVSSVADTPTEVAPFQASVPASVLDRLMIAVLPLVAETVAPAPIVPPLSVKVPALTTATTEPETIVAPLTAFFVPLTVSMRALGALVCSLPPEMPTPSSRAASDCLRR